MIMRSSSSWAGYFTFNEKAGVQISMAVPYSKHEYKFDVENNRGCCH